MAHEPISTAYFINPSHQSVCLYVYPLIVARQRLGKNVTAATNTHATIEELLDASFSIRSVSYQRNVGDQFFPELLVISVVFLPLIFFVISHFLLLLSFLFLSPPLPPSLSHTHTHTTNACNDVCTVSLWTCIPVG
jgi:hypothetical protein